MPCKKTFLRQFSIPGGGGIQFGATLVKASDKSKGCQHDACVICIIRKELTPETSYFRRGFEARA